MGGGGGGGGGGGRKDWLKERTAKAFRTKGLGATSGTWVTSSPKLTIWRQKTMDPSSRIVLLNRSSRY